MDATTALARIERLESELQWWRRITVVCVALASLVLLTGQAGDRDRVLETEKLVIKDRKGNVRIVLGAESTGPAPASAPFLVWHQDYGVHIWGSDGRPRARMTDAHDSEGGLLVLASAQPASEAWLETAGTNRQQILPRPPWA